MTTAGTAVPPARAVPALLVAGFGLALLLRVSVGGPEVSRSAVAGLVFAAALGALCTCGRPASGAGVRVVLSGLAVAALLCLPVLLLRDGPLVDQPGFLRWAAIVGVVATVEELFLRGVLYEAIERRWSAGAAVLLGAVLFALLHVPLYGWHVVPLDLVVGLLLGELRRASGSWVAPAVAHVTADWAAWFLR